MVHTGSVNLFGLAAAINVQTGVVWTQTLCSESMSVADSVYRVDKSNNVAQAAGEYCYSVVVSASRRFMCVCVLLVCGWCA